MNATDAKNMSKNANTTNDRIEWVESRIEYAASKGERFCKTFIDPSDNYKSIKSYFTVKGYKVKRCWFYPSEVTISW